MTTIPRFNRSRAGHRICIRALATITSLVFLAGCAGGGERRARTSASACEVIRRHTGLVPALRGLGSRAEESPGLSVCVFGPGGEPVLRAGLERAADIPTRFMHRLAESQQHCVERPHCRVEPLVLYPGAAAGNAYWESDIRNLVARRDTRLWVFDFADRLPDRRTERAAIRLARASLVLRR